MNTKRYKDYDVEIRVIGDTCKKYNISGKSNDVARNLKQILHASELNRDEYKDIMKWFEKIIQEYANTSCIFRPYAKEIHVTENVVLIVHVILTDANTIDIHRMNKHGENVHEKRKKQIELSKRLNQKKFEKAINTLKENLEKLKNSKIASDTLLDKLQSCRLKSTFSYLDCCDEKSIVINNTVIIDLDDFVLHGELIGHTNPSTNSLYLSIYYTRVFDKHACVDFLKDLNLLDNLVCSAKNINMLEKLNDNLSKKLKMHDIVEKR